MMPGPDRELADIAAAQHGVFTRSDARQAKLSEDQIKVRIDRQWVRIHEGVYRAGGAPVTWRGDLLAAALVCGDGAAISHRSAAAIYELPGGRDDLVELTCRRWERTRRGDLVVHESRRLDPRDIQVVDGIPVTVPERVILDLASLRPVPTYLEMVIHAARRKRLITYESTQAMFDRHARRGLRGAAALRSVLAEWNPDNRATESDMETRLLQALLDHGLPQPILQYEAFDTQGALIARTDAAYPSHRIAIEYDSMQEHSDEFQLSRDARRRNALQAAGYAVLSVRHQDLVAGGGLVCAQISAIIRRTA